MTGYMSVMILIVIVKPEKTEHCLIWAGLLIIMDPH